MKEYKSQNLYECSYLVQKGFQFSGKEPAGNKITLVFPNSEQLNQTVIEFYAGGTAKAKELFDWYRNLKDYCFSQR